MGRPLFYKINIRIIIKIFIDRYISSQEIGKGRYQAGNHACNDLDV